MRFVRYFLIGFVAVYALIVGVMFAYQRDLIYRPDQIARVQPSYYPMLAGVQEIELKTSDGLKVYAWYAPAPPGRPTVAVFHGNGGSLRSQRYRLSYFKEAGMGVLVLGYRGYAGSDGWPSEEGLYTDARTAIAWLNANGVADSSIVLYGESLGTGVASKMATEHKVAAVVLESPYTSLIDVAAWQFPYIPVRWLMWDRFDTLSRIGEVSAPVLVMHGDKDVVVPQDFGRQVFAAAKAPKESLWLEGRGHNEIFDNGGFTTAREFIDRWFKP